MLLLLTGSCTRFKSWFGSEPERLAQIGKEILYKKDLEGLLQNTLSATDSVNLINHYIDIWAIDNLLLKKAEEALSKEEKDVKQELADYRKSLLVFRYQKKYVESRIDTTVSQEEISDYYNNHRELFLLDAPLLKARFVKIRLQSPYLPMIRNLYRSYSLEDMRQLDRLCESSAEVYTHYDDKWLTLRQLAQDLPSQAKNDVYALRSKGYLDTRDSLYAYLVSVYDYLQENTPAPAEFKETEIRQNILSRRKQQLLKDLEKEVLKEGWNKQLIKTYKKDEK
ncbi:MAG: hypothetical protein WBK97_00745 [Bacteroidales bacterium]|jgi:hypothetical protein